MALRNRKPKTAPKCARCGTRLCPTCSRHVEHDELVGLQAADYRWHMLLQSPEPQVDMFAYGYACSGIFPTQENWEDFCVCQRIAWNAAIERYRRRGGAWCWASLGVTAELEQQAKDHHIREFIWKHQTVRGSEAVN